MRKKVLSLIIAVILSLAIFPIKIIASANPDKSYKTCSLYLAETGTGQVLYAKNENERRPIASMTKIMLLNLCFEAIESGELNFDEKIIVSKTASGMGGSQVFLEADEKYKAEDLIKSIIVASANDASVAIFN